MRRALWAVAFLMAMVGQVASAQIWDRSGNSQLSGAYSFREVIYLPASDGSVQGAYSVFGAITFDGRGNYTLAGTFVAPSSQSSTYTSSGTYSLAASGYGFMRHPFSTTATDTMNILFSNGVLMGSSTESFINDVLFAVPSNPQNASMFSGSYSMAYLNVGATYTSTYDTMAQLFANNGNIGTVTIKSYLGSAAAPINQTESAVTYSFSNNTGTLRFPTSPANLPLKGNMQMYISQDGNFIFGGNPAGWDIFVGVRRGGGTPPVMSGLYYSVGLNHVPGDFDSFFGGYYAYSASGALWEHQRGLLSYLPNPTNYTAAGTFPSNSVSDYTDSASDVEYTIAQNAQFRIGIGQSPYMSLRVAVQAPIFTAPAGTAPWINPTGVQNSASSAIFTAGVSHGELMTIYGANLASSTVITQGGITFPKTLGGVQVLMNNQAVPLYYVSPTQVAVIVPYGIPPGVVQVQVVNNNGTSNAVTEFVYTTGPGLFSESTQGQGLAKILHADYRQVTPDNPTIPGDVLQIFLTGLGDVSPTIADGGLGPVPPQQLAEAVANITAYVDNIQAPVGYAGLAPGLAGLYQVNITVPSGVHNGNVYVDIATPDAYTSQVTVPMIGGSAPPREATAHVHRR